MADAPRSVSLEKLAAEVNDLRTMHERILKFQENSYHWNLKVHTNLKTVVDTVNEVVDAIEDLRSELKMKKAEPRRPKPSPSPPPPPRAPERKSFHERVMAFATTPESPEFHRLLLSVTSSEFEELNEMSLAVIIPAVIEHFLDDPKRVPFALVYQFETMNKFPVVFSFSTVAPFVARALRFLRRHKATDFKAIESPALSAPEIFALCSFYAARE